MVILSVINVPIAESIMSGRNLRTIRGMCLKGGGAIIKMHGLFGKLTKPAE